MSGTDTGDGDGLQMLVKMSQQTGAKRSDRVRAVVVHQKPNRDVTTLLKSRRQALLVTTLTRCTQYTTVSSQFTMPKSKLTNYLYASTEKTTYEHRQKQFCSATIKSLKRQQPVKAVCKMVTSRRGRKTLKIPTPSNIN